MIILNFAAAQLKTLRRLKDETEGNVAIIFALLTIPLFLLMGFAIDLQQVNTAKNRVQYILDSAVIAGAREMQEGKSDTQIKAYILNYFESAMKAQGMATDCADPVSTIASESQDISVTVRCDQPTSIMQITGTKELTFGVTSASTYGIGKVDIAFVFDVSGSMGGSKMTALKDAAETAVDVHGVLFLDGRCWQRLFPQGYRQDAYPYLHGDLYNSRVRRLRICLYTVPP